MVLIEEINAFPKTITMNKFNFGLITKWGTKCLTSENVVQTPSYLIYTRAGHIPHLTWDLVAKHLRFHQNIILQLTLPTIFEYQHLIKSSGGNFNNYHLTKNDYLTHLSICDPLGKRIYGYNNTSSVSVWIKGGRKAITPRILRNSLHSIEPDSFSTLLDYDTSIDCLNKKLTKALQRTINFCDSTCDYEGDKIKSKAIMTLGGGFSKFHRQQMAKDLASKHYAEGFSIDLSNFSQNPFYEKRETFEMEKIKSLLDPVFLELDSSKPRLVEGVFLPEQVVLLILNFGISLFDSSYAIWLTENGRAFQIGIEYPQDPLDYQIIDFNDKNYSEDSGPVTKNCACYTCKNYSKAYLYHLCNTKEMLASTLLVIHNMNMYDKMFVKIREFLKKDLI